MKAQIIKSTEPILESQVMIIAPPDQLKKWWNVIGLCILERIHYCVDKGYMQTAKDLRQIYEEIEEQIKGDE